MYRKLALLVAIIVTGMSIRVALSLGSDSKQVMHIEADSSTFDYKTGLNIFEGNVKVTQGSTHLAADKLTTKRDKRHQITEAIAYGIKHRAKYWTQLQTGKKPIVAEANVMRYYPQKGKMTLQQDVDVIQGKNSFQGELVIYNVNNQTVHVPASNNARSVLVYHPDEKR